MIPKHLALLLGAAFACSSPQQLAVVEPPAAPPAVITPAEDTSFPGGWIGAWRGPLQIEIAGKPPQTMAMELHITPLEAPGRWTFRLVYNGEPRDYVLIAVDAARGLYQVDEQNSIVVDARLVGDTLLSQFSVQDNFVQARYHRVGAALELEILMVSWKTPNKTGGANGVPEVQSFPIRVVQRATLTRWPTRGARSRRSSVRQISGAVRTGGRGAVALRRAAARGCRACAYVTRSARSAPCLRVYSPRAAWPRQPSWPRWHWPCRWPRAATTTTTRYRSRRPVPVPTAPR